METQSITIKLPVSGKNIQFKPFITTGQSRELQKILLKNGTFNTEAGKLDNVSADTFMEMQEKAAEFLIIGFSDTNGGIVRPYTKEELDALPMQDGNIVFDKVNELTQASQLSTGDQKN